MNSYTLNALKDSISHWEEIANCPPTADAILDINMDPRHCSLCLRFFEYYSNGHCSILDDNGKVQEKCPVYEKTGYTNCEYTPYDFAYDLHKQETKEIEKQEDAYIPTDFFYEMKVHAKEEVEFLRSLLPKDSSIDGE